jgi:hypothetical protein
MCNCMQKKNCRLIVKKKVNQIKMGKSENYYIANIQVKGTE